MTREMLDSLFEDRELSAADWANVATYAVCLGDLTVEYHGLMADMIRDPRLVLDEDGEFFQDAYND